MSRVQASNGPGGGSPTQYDKDATIRSNRSGRSSRSLHLAVNDLRASRNPRSLQSSQPPPPPPPYQASQSPSLEGAAQRDLSPSTMSLSSSRWDERNPRWSVWTADTSLSDENEYGHDVVHDKGTTRSRGAMMTHVPRGIAMGALHDEYERPDSYDDDAGPSCSSPPSRASTPPSPTSEAALDAALSSTMLALTTANSLLLSTMASRRELARLRALEAALDGDFARKEADIKRKIESNNRMIGWMERASKRLDDVIEGRDSEDGSMTEAELDELTASRATSEVGPSSGSTPAPFLPSSIVMARHSRVASVATANARDVPVPFGIVEAKDETSTVGKSAAKRLERMLQRSQNAASETMPPPSRLDVSTGHVRSSSSSVSPGAGVEASTTAVDVSPARPSIARHARGNALQLRLSSSKLASPMTASSDVSLSTPVSEQSLRRLDGNVTSSSRQSVSGLSESGISTAPSSHVDEANANKDDGPASRLLSSIINGRPNAATSKRVSSIEDTTNEGRNTRREATDSTTVVRPASLAVGSASYFLTTPPMPANQEFSPNDEANDSAAGTPSTMLRHRPSLTNARSPSALQVVGGRGSSVPNNEARGVAVNDIVHGTRTHRKGALEALRRLNSNGTTSTAEAEDSAGANGGESIRGWGGTLASWMGISGGGVGVEGSTGPEPTGAAPSYF